MSAKPPSPPYSLPSERGVLGSILLDSERVLDLSLASGLIPDSFYLPAHKAIFAALMRAQKGNIPIDYNSLQNILTADELSQIGGLEYIAGIIEEAPTSAHAEYHITQVRKTALLRRALECIRKVEHECYYGDPQDADEIVSRAEQLMLDVAQSGDVGITADWSVAVKNTMYRIDHIMSGGFSGLSTGFINIDEKLRGLRPTEMIVLAARPSMGKTSLAMNIAECLSLGKTMAGLQMRDGPVGVGIFSLEMSQESLAMRMLCGRAQVPFYQIESHFYGKDKQAEAMRSLSATAAELSHAKIYIDDTGGLDVMELRARARRMKKQHDIKAIVIDYLQLLHCREYAKQGNTVVEIGAVSANIKSMAKELNVPVIILSQLNRGPETRTGSDDKPRLSDLRDSGAIEQDADIVLMLRRPCRSVNKKDPDREDDRLAILNVAKNRNGPTGDIRLDFDDKFTRFGDRAEGHLDDDSFGEPIEE